MGLDMYLEAERYVSGWSRSDTDEKQRYAAILDTVGLAGSACKESPGVTIAVTVAYWRKANAIHKWFVDNCQDGVDECQRTEIERNKLVALIGLCKRVLESIETVEGRISEGSTHHPGGEVVQHTRAGQVVEQQGFARSTLPTQGGCFFGSTAYDECYLADLRATIKQVEPLLALQDVSFYYRASW